MTDEEFERLKEAEKAHLREKKRLRSRLEALKKRRRTQSVVQTMKRGAERLLEETGSLVETLRRSVAQADARFEVGLEDEEDPIQEAEEELREERAEALLRQYKTAQSPTGSSESGRTSKTADDGASSEEDETMDGPEKTIGRMRIPRSETDDA